MTATINHLGAELVSLKSENKEFIWNGNPDFWGKHAPVLFPIVGTLKEGKYVYENKRYSLSRHGFAREMEFNLLHSQSDRATFSLVANNTTLAVYPFDFELRIHYKIDTNALQISYTIINNGNTKMPFSVGAHPAFATLESFTNYTLAFELQEELYAHELENDLISDNKIAIATSDKKLPLSYALFEKDALIFKNIKSKSITILENNRPYLRVNYSDFKHLGLWTKPNAPFICIEPWLGFSDNKSTSGNIFEKEGIEILDEKSRFDCSFDIQIL